MLFRKHYSEEQLLAYLDGEVPLARRLLMVQHLQLCWLCRKRKAELERSVEEVTAALNEPWNFDPRRTLSAKQRFVEKRAAVDQAVESRPTFGPPPLRFSLAGAAVAGLVLAGWFIAPRPSAPVAPPDARRILAQAVSSSPPTVPAAPSAVLVQSFRLELSGNSPAKRTVRGRLDLYYEGGARRASARWLDESGHVRFASVADLAARTISSSRGDITSARFESTGRTVLAQAIAGSRELDALEKAFARWLAESCWQPVSLASDFAVFTNAGGASLTAERILGEGGQLFLRLTASRTVDGQNVEAILELEPSTLAVRLGRLRMARQDRRLELTLRAEPVRLVNASLVNPAVFAVERPDTSPLLRSAQASRAPLTSPSGAISLPPGPQEVWEQEIAIHSALHDAGLCASEPLEVRASRTGLTVYGVLRDEERLRQVLSVIRRSNPPAWVSANLQTYHEAMAGRTLPSTPPGESVPPLPGPAASSIPANDLLVRYLRSTGVEEPAAISRQLARLSSQAVIHSQNALLDLWALRRHLGLAVRGGDWQPSPGAARQLERLVADHARGLEQHAGANLQLLRPLAQFARRETGLAKSPSDTSTPLATWDQLGADADHANRLVLSLFAAGGASTGLNGREVDRLLDLDNLLQRLSHASGFALRREAVWRQPR